MSIWVDDIGPRVLPPLSSDLLTNSWYLTPLSLQIDLYIDIEYASLVYAWFAFIFITGPLPITGLFVGSCFSGIFGWTACAKSEDIINDEYIDVKNSSLVFPSDIQILSSIFNNIFESAPCFVELPTSSLSNTATIFIPLLLFAFISAFKLAWAIAKLSSLPLDINSSFAPIKHPFSNSYKNKSKSTMSSLSTPSLFSNSFIR